MKVQLEIKMPILPNYCIVMVGDKETTVALTDLTEEEINEYVETFKKAILDKWNKWKRNKVN